MTDFAETGGRVGGGVGVWLTDHFALRADGNFAFFPGEEQTTTIIEMPTMGVSHFALGMELDVLPPTADTRWNLTTHVGCRSIGLRHRYRAVIRSSARPRRSRAPDWV